MILYKYLEAKYGLQAILDSQLKVSLPTELNDPFEMLPRDCGNWTLSKVKRFLKDKQSQNRIYEILKSQRKAKNKKEFKNSLKDNNTLSNNLLIGFQSKDFWESIQDSKKDCDEYMRLLCFSSEYAKGLDEILMWSHYSDKHKGMRLHYNSKSLSLPSFDLREIKYASERPPVDYTIDKGAIEFRNQLETALFTKSECWTYEKEYRLFIDPNYCTKVIINHQNVFFAKLPSVSLVRVDLGLRCESRYFEDAKHILKDGRFGNISFYKATLNKNDFKIEYERIT